jgi:hypothetical protein
MVQLFGLLVRNVVKKERENLPRDKRPAKKARIQLPSNYFRYVNPIITAVIVIGLFVFVTVTIQ